MHGRLVGARLEWRGAVRQARWGAVRSGQSLRGLARLGQARSGVVKRQEVCK
jgi:hypothetical protein